MNKLTEFRVYQEKSCNFRKISTQFAPFLFWFLLIVFNTVGKVNSNISDSHKGEDIYHVWGVDSEDKIWRLSGIKWELVPGRLTHISAGVDDTVWGVNRFEQIWRWNGSEWERMPGLAKQISVGNANHIWAVNRFGQIWKWNGSDWERKPGAAKHISVGSDGTVWAVNSFDQIWRWDGSRWIEMPGLAKQISVGDANHIWAVNRYDQIWKWNGDNWDRVPGALKYVSVGQGANIWGVNSFDQVWRWDGKSWNSVPGTFRQLECGKVNMDPKLAEVLEPATEKKTSVLIDRNLTLQSHHIVTKRLIFEGSKASDVTLNGNGATIISKKGSKFREAMMIEVRSRVCFDNGTCEDNPQKYSNPPDGWGFNSWTWDRPENIMIKNCSIFGVIRVWGMWEDYHRQSSIESKHVERARNSAPKNIVFDNLKITAVTTTTPFYLAVGVTHSKLMNSEISGKANMCAIYLDAESGWNTIKDNYIHVKTEDSFLPQKVARPLINIDGSSYNKIINNRFSELSNGGIYLYRNCGERGAVRHSTPSNNQIINNIFYYKNFHGLDPAIFLGSRNWGEGIINGIFRDGYCDDDDGYGFGSSLSNNDHATHNVVMQNQLYDRFIWKNVRNFSGEYESRLVQATLDDMIKTQNRSVNSPNFVDNNQLVTDKTVEIDRPAGCYVQNDGIGFMLHGESIDVSTTPFGGYNYSCNNGDVTRKILAPPDSGSIAVKVDSTPQHQFSEGTGFKFSLRPAEDWSNNVIDYSSEGFSESTVTEDLDTSHGMEPPIGNQITTATLELKKGKNLVSIPILPANPDPKVVFSGIDGEVKQWISTDEGDGHYVEPREVKPFVGYWVYSDRDQAISVTGSPIADDAVPLNAGWNLIGVAEESTIKKDNGPYEALEFDGLSYKETDILRPNKGYFVYSSSATLIELKPVKPDQDQ